MSAIGINDNNLYPWFAPAGFNRGALSSVSQVDVRLTAGDRDTLYDARINPNATIEEGQNINLAIDPAKLHYFDPETGMAIT